MRGNNLLRVDDTCLGDNLQDSPPAHWLKVEVGLAETYRLYPDPARPSLHYGFKILHDLSLLDSLPSYSDPEPRLPIVHVLARFLLLHALVQDTKPTSYCLGIL